MLFFKKKIKNTRDSRKALARAHENKSILPSTSIRQKIIRRGIKYTKRNTKHTQGFFSFIEFFLSFKYIDWGIFRIRFVVFIFALAWLGLWGRAWYVQIIQGPYLADQASRQYTRSVLMTGKRGAIVDRHGQVLARSVESRSVYINPSIEKDVSNTAKKLAEILQMPPERLEEQLVKKTRKFIWVARKIDDYRAEAIKDAKLIGVGLAKEYHRVYPFKQMAGHLLGFVGVDNQGLEGLERSFDSELMAKPVRHIVQRDALKRLLFLEDEGLVDPIGKTIQLTLDTQLQFFAEEAITLAVKDSGAAWGGILMVDVESGDIISWAQYPFFNPNAYRDYTPSQYRNRLATDAIEPGSTLKPFLVASALQEGTVTKDTVFDCENGRWQMKDIVIRDTSAHKKLNVADILRYSSNIGVAKIGKELGAKTYYKYLTALGFGKRTVVPVAEHKGIVRKPLQWADADLLSTSFGQSISVTGLQMVQAYLTLINNGTYKPLRLVINNDIEVEKDRPSRIFRKDVAQTVMQMLQAVVEEDGSGKRAKIAGIKVAGKTGTAQKADKRTGTYGTGRMLSFVGFAPANKPKFLTLVMIDEPSKSTFGGVLAAPVFQKVTSMALMYDGQLPDRVFTDGSPIIRRGITVDTNLRGLRLASAPMPIFSMPLLNKIESTKPYNTLPDQESKASLVVPNVVGKTVRNAVELFARGGIIPILKGNGKRVVQQSPQAGAEWPKATDTGKKLDYYLQLSEK